MFLRPNTLNALMKKAYKRGLALAQTMDGWIYIAGDYWQVSVRKEFIPKRTLGDIIALTGELPEPGTRFTATKEGNQIEMEMAMSVNDEPFKEKNILTVTDMLLVGTAGTVQRLLQDEDTGNIYVVNNAFVGIVDNALIDNEHGEYAVSNPFFHPQYGILWKNNVCKMRVQFRLDDKNIKVLKNLRGVDITPEVPET